MLIPFSKSYRARPIKMKTVALISSATMPKRKSDSEARILLAVAVASPITMKTEGI